MLFDRMTFSVAIGWQRDPVPKYRLITDVDCAEETWRVALQYFVALADASFRARELRRGYGFAKRFVHGCRMSSWWMLRASPIADRVGPRDYMDVYGATAGKVEPATD